MELVPPLGTEDISRKFPETAKSDRLKTGCGFAPLWASDKGKVTIRNQTTSRQTATYLALGFMIFPFAEAGNAPILRRTSSQFTSSGSDVRKITKKFSELREWPIRIAIMPV